MNTKLAERHGSHLVLHKNKEDSEPKSAVLSVRITPKLRDEMERAATTGPYRIPITAIVQRGIMLAIRELDELANRIK